MAKIAILGCGPVGRAAAERLLRRKELSTLTREVLGNVLKQLKESLVQNELDEAAEIAERLQVLVETMKG